jgi:hypothetical protein
VKKHLSAKNANNANNANKNDWPGKTIKQLQSTQLNTGEGMLYRRSTGRA